MSLNIVIESYGCTANRNDSELIAGLLEKKGCNVIFGNASKIGGDIVILNGCIVKGPTLKRMERRLYDILKTNKKVIITGCFSFYKERIAKIVKKIENEGKRSYVSVTRDIKEIPKIILSFENKTKLERIKEISPKKPTVIKVGIEKKKLNSIIGINQICTGCTGKCTFCATRLVKGYVKSYPIEAIVKSISQDVKEGCKEILLTATDLGCYGLDDGGYKLIDLLNSINEIKGKFLVRLGMINPGHLINFIDEFVECCKSEKFFKFLHLPLESGNDEVLKEMNRDYKVKDFLKIVKKFRKNFPDSVIATDIITGFYNENESAFKDTIRVIREIKPDILHISRFWPMPKTPAYEKMRGMNRNEVELILDMAKKRAKILHDLHKKIALEKNKKFIGKEVLCLIENKGYDKTFLARDINYRLVGIKSENKKFMLGQFYKIKIKDAKSNFLIA
ncbi:MAG: tRNA (N(6)-L-threonylcarbamoyladenosine(37)-C(2))-methylthiotransferase [Candidatus Pacearchaeota archaeon]